MKRFLITTATILLSFTLMAQDEDNYLSVGAGVDIRNAIIGSKPTGNSPSADLIFQFTMAVEDIHIHLSYETMPRLDFEKYAVGLGYHFRLYSYLGGNEFKTTFIPTIEPTGIIRKDNWGEGIGDNTGEAKWVYGSVGLNLSLNWKLSDNFMVEYTFNALPRTDLRGMYPKESWNEKFVIGGVPVVGSNYIKLIFKIDMR